MTKVTIPDNDVFTFLPFTDFLSVLLSDLSSNVSPLLIYEKIYNLRQRFVFKFKPDTYFLQVLQSSAYTSYSSDGTVYLYICKIKDSPYCKRWGEEETIGHLLWNCESVRQFWKELENSLRSKCQNCKRIIFSLELVGTKGNTITDKGFDFVLLMAKFYIYKCKFQEALPEVIVFISQFNYSLRIEQKCCIQNG